MTICCWEYWRAKRNEGFGDLRSVGPAPRDGGTAGLSDRGRIGPDPRGAGPQRAIGALHSFRPAAPQPGRSLAGQGEARPLDPDPRRSGRLLEHYRRYRYGGRRRLAAPCGYQGGLGGRGHRRVEMLLGLQKIQDSQPKDMSRYDFVLRQSLDGTNDSLDLARQDPTVRAAAVATKQAKETKEREDAMTPTERDAKKAEEAKAEKEKKKAPTLLRPGETAKDQQKDQQ